MQWVDVASRVLHVLTAITLLGGAIFQRACLLPALASLSPEDQERVRTSVIGYWKKFVHSGIAILLVTGLYNMLSAKLPPETKGLYHALIGTKLLLALVIFVIASGLVGRSNAFAKMRANPRPWLTLSVLLGLVIVGISGYVKVVVRPPAKPAATAPIEAPPANK